MDAARPGGRPRGLDRDAPRARRHAAAPRGRGVPRPRHLRPDGRPLGEAHPPGDARRSIASSGSSALIAGALLLPALSAAAADGAAQPGARPRRSRRRDAGRALHPRHAAGELGRRRVPHGRLRTRAGPLPPAVRRRDAAARRSSGSPTWRIEPWIRRHWPSSLVSWTRLLAARRAGSARRARRADRPGLRRRRCRSCCSSSRCVAGLAR